MRKFTAKILIALAGVLISCALMKAQNNFPLKGQWTNSLGMVFVSMPHTKVLFSIYETRVKDFAGFAATQPQLDGTNWDRALYHNKTPVSAGAGFPVVNVSWNDAQAFCVWLTKNEQQAGTIKGKEFFRLPTDAEWSWAVGIGEREGEGTPKEKNSKIPDLFPWGTQFPPPPGAGNFADQAALNYFTNWPHIDSYNDGFVTTAPVGSFKPNEFGIYDLAGNAMEWCDDFYNGTNGQRVLRGGAWINCGPKSLWSSYREHAGASRYSVATGFRPVLVKDSDTK
ncbi:MAG TPA: SUMF1/EgtB/PvdO family nonheme iron enzyme [Pseudomonadales bacterium]|nr:SUMF1/EgtB/PvdO family nonheme iron enzyme [Pseudomonadales bacterium]